MKPLMRAVALLLLVASAGCFSSTAPCWVVTVDTARTESGVVIAYIEYWVQCGTPVRAPGDTVRAR
jgi:hypothetical protein